MSCDDTYQRSTQVLRRIARCAACRNGVPKHLPVPLLRSMLRLIFAARLQTSKDVEQLQRHDLGYRPVADVWVYEVAEGPVGLLHRRRREPFALQFKPLRRDHREGVGLRVLLNQALDGWVVLGLGQPSVDRISGAPGRS